jgi:hypothetical protein
MPDSGITKAQALRATLVPLGIMTASLLMWVASQAAFSGRADSGDSAFGAGVVSLETGDPGKSSIGSAALFNAHKIAPGYSEERCVTLTSHSDVDTWIKMYGVDFSYTPLTEALTVHVSKGTVDDDQIKGTSCSTYHDDAKVYDGTLAGFGRESKGYSSGSSVAPEGDSIKPRGHATYRIVLSLPLSADNSVSGKASAATFKWEAQD